MHTVVVAAMVVPDEPDLLNITEHPDLLVIFLPCIVFVHQQIESKKTHMIVSSQRLEWLIGMAGEVLQEVAQLQPQEQVEEQEQEQEEEEEEAPVVSQFVWFENN